MRETWYVLEDGSVVDPRDCGIGEDGRMRHKSGIAVAMRGDTHSSRGVENPDERRAMAAKAEADDPPKSSREMKAEGGRSYRTRGSKAD